MRLGRWELRWCWQQGDSFIGCYYGAEWSLWWFGPVELWRYDA